MKVCEMMPEERSTLSLNKHLRNIVGMVGGSMFALLATACCTTSPGTYPAQNLPQARGECREVSLEVLNVASETLVKDIFLGTVSCSDRCTGKTSWRIEGPAADDPGAYILVVDIMAGPYKGQYRAAMGLVLYTKVSAPLRIGSIHLIQCPENTFLAVDYAAVYHTNGPDVCAWEYALFPLVQSAPQGKEPLEPAFKEGLKTLTRITEPLRNPCVKPFWHAREEGTYLCLADNATPQGVAAWYRYDANARHFLAVLEPEELNLPSLDAN